MRESVTVEIALRYWDAYRANLRIILYSPLQVALSAIFPIAGAFILLRLISSYDRLPLFELLWEVLVVIVAFGFTPIVLLITLYVGRRKNTLARGPFTYTLDSAGIRVLATNFETAIKWPGIRRVVETKSFLFLFIATGRALCLPLEQLQSAGALSDVREIVRRNTAVPPT